MAAFTLGQEELTLDRGEAGCQLQRQKNGEQHINTIFLRRSPGFFVPLYVIKVLIFTHMYQG